MPATAVVINALCDALSQAGVEDLPLPATAEVVWRSAGEVVSTSNPKEKK